MAMALVTLAGTLVCPRSFLPHHITVPSAFNARLCASPAATPTALVSPVGTVGLTVCVAAPRIQGNEEPARGPEGRDGATADPIADKPGQSARTLEKLDL